MQQSRQATTSGGPATLLEGGSAASLCKPRVCLPSMTDSVRHPLPGMTQPMGVLAAVWDLSQPLLDTMTQPMAGMRMTGTRSFIIQLRTSSMSLCELACCHGNAWLMVLLTDSLGSLPRRMISVGRGLLLTSTSHPAVTPSCCKEGKLLHVSTLHMTPPPDQGDLWLFSRAQHWSFQSKSCFMKGRLPARSHHPIPAPASLHPNTNQ